MSKASRLIRLAFLALVAIASSLPARADDAQARTRVTIRGAGSNVAIERTQAPLRKRALEKDLDSTGALGDAIRLKSNGADDPTVVAYLRAHQADLPSIIDARDVQRLQKAGAGRSLITSLATLAAVDIGETGEGREPSPYYPPMAPAIDATYDYPFVGGYSAFPARFRRGVFFRHMTFHPRRPIPHRPMRMQPMSTHRLMPE